MLKCVVSVQLENGYRKGDREKEREGELLSNENERIQSDMHFKVFCPLIFLSL